MDYSVKASTLPTLESSIIINGKSVRTKLTVDEIEIDKRRKYYIQILDMSNLKLKGGQKDGITGYEIFNPVKNMIKRYYKSVKKQLSDEEYKGLPCLVLQYLLSFEIVDGNFAFADEIVQDYFNWFE